MTDIATRDLATCEAVIERGLATFVEVGQALAEIRDSRLYRDTHESFEDYCVERWDMGRNYANKLIVSAEVATAVGTNVPSPRTESVARALASFKDEPTVAAEVWERVVAEHGPNPTQRQTREMVREVQTNGLKPARKRLARPPLDTKRGQQLANADAERVRQVVYAIQGFAAQDIDYSGVRGVMDAEEQRRILRDVANALGAIRTLRAELKGES